jgi:hypothetical protein
MNLGHKILMIESRVLQDVYNYIQSRIDLL